MRKPGPLVAHYWLIKWDLRDCSPRLAETLPHPNVHLVLEPSGSNVAGVQTSKFSRTLEGKSKVFGIKFKPGGFRPFVKEPVSRLANRTIPAHLINDFRSIVGVSPNQYGKQLAAV